ncbi:MAG: hypothetical protein KAT28_00150 [Candidatus Aenigmarchaeota archaeon]|nr:hypothetical protein [Candidatus Aenigmarchaeota archaeon]
MGDFIDRLEKYSKELNLSAGTVQCIKDRSRFPELNLPNGDIYEILVNSGIKSLLIPSLKEVRENLFLKLTPDEKTETLRFEGLDMELLIGTSPEDRIRIDRYMNPKSLLPIYQ